MCFVLIESIAATSSGSGNTDWVHPHDRRAPMCSCSLLLHYYMIAAGQQINNTRASQWIIGLGKHRQTLANCSKQRALHALVLWLSCGGRWSHRGDFFIARYFSRCLFQRIVAFFDKLKMLDPASCTMRIYPFFFCLRSGCCSQLGC